MSRGIVLIAHNNGKDDYFAMATSVARRANEFLDLPVTLVTDVESYRETGYTYDRVIFVDPDTTNRRMHAPWINKGRHRVFDYTPYSDTLVLDTDYMINSSMLLRAYDIPSDFCIHRNVTWLFGNNTRDECISTGLPTHWATVLRFKKTSRVESIFNMVNQVQSNYVHYSNIYGFNPAPFRNDYAFTIALKVINGHIPLCSDYFYWNLVHVPLGVEVHRTSRSSYDLIRHSNDNTSGRNSYIKISGLDFHMLDKKNFLELTHE
jgi:hypothetical protein